MKLPIGLVALLCSAVVATAAEAPSADTVAKGLQTALSSLVAQMNSTISDGKTPAAELSVPLPEKLGKLETTLRAAGQGTLVDDFKAKLKEVALKSLPQAGKLLKDGTANVTMSDPMTVLRAAPSGLTDFAKQQTRSAIIQKLTPLVATQGKAAGLTASYQAMVAKAGPLASKFFGKELPTNIDQYLAEQTLDYSYLLLGKGEAALRANPSLLKNSLVKKVFASATPSAK